MLPAPFSHLQRYSLPATEQRLSDDLSLPWTSGMQDWAIEVGHAALVPRLFELLRRGDRSDLERSSLMTLAVACVAAALIDGAGPMILEDLRHLLIIEPALRASTIYYWAEPVLDGEDIESWFDISSFMAGVWREVRDGLPSGPPSA
ncbi:hypothetical protein ACQ86G_03585 [Roseateles chitinivorans]|uniref:hypothetical protein n=1 Tax=Roseateles chitinivorans TaxID=2917965 RepID=UPI003D677C62